MIELDLKTGYLCNNNCIFCLNKDKKYYKVYPIKIIFEQIAKAAAAGCRRVIITGGEPLISPDIFRVLAFARDAGIEFVEIQTNGRMLYYEEMVDRILEIRPMQFAFLVSMHFPTAALYRRYCQADGFSQVSAGIRNLLERGARVTINTAVMRQNIGLLDDIVMLALRLGVSYHQLRTVHGHNVMDRYAEFVPRMSETAGAVRRMIRKYHARMSFSAHEIPLCILGLSAKRYMSPVVNPERIVLSVGDKPVMFEEIVSKQFVFAPCCGACRYRQSCRGVRKEYGAFYGLEELKTLRR